MDQETLHRALLKAGAYPERPVAVTTLETHVSRLYFTDGHVYKVKKPVDFGFLNFTTLDRRHFYCDEEVRLNRRFAPDTYLGVVEIRSEEGRVRIDGTGPIVEFAVRMKRLPAERMLDRLIELRDPDLPAEMERLAARIAELHRESEVCPAGPAESNLEVVLRNTRENLDQTAPFVGKTLAPGALERTRALSEGFLAEQADLLLGREARGHVRDGHGDLHAEHVCLTDPIRIYDCIEFSRRFRVADLAADLAFLLMDLEHRDRRDLAERLLCAYQACLPADPDLPVLLPFYKVYRAWVRGKVESFLAFDAGAPEAVRRAAADRASSYFALALGYQAPVALYLACGLMGTGKTTLARGLAAATGAALLRSDVLRKESRGLPAGRPSPEGFAEGIYRPEITAETYRLLLEGARKEMAQGRPVVIDASFARAADRAEFRAAARRAGFPCLLFHATCPRETALERLDRREHGGGDASDGRRELFDPQAAAFESPESEPGVLQVDTRNNVDYNVQLILTKNLEQAGPGP